MAKLLKWIVHTQEIFMWPRDYGLHSTGDSFPDISVEFSDNDSDMEDLSGGLEEMEEVGPEQQENVWKLRIEYTNGIEQEMYGGEELPERAEELYFTLLEYFEPDETEWE